MIENQSTYYDIYAHFESIHNLLMKRKPDDKLNNCWIAEKLLHAKLK